MNERENKMRKLFMKSVSAVLVLAMLLSLLSVSAYATTNVDIKINDINNNVLPIISFPLIFPFFNIFPKLHKNMSLY